MPSLFSLQWLFNQITQACLWGLKRETPWLKLKIDLIKTLSSSRDLRRQTASSHKSLYSRDACNLSTASVCVMRKSQGRRAFTDWHFPSVCSSFLRSSLAHRAAWTQRTFFANSCWPSIWPGRLAGTSGTWPSQHTRNTHPHFAGGDISLTERYWDPEDYMHSGMHTHTNTHTHQR